MMLSATKAKEIMDAAVEKRNGEIRCAIEGEVREVCEHIEKAANNRSGSYRIPPNSLRYPDGVKNYLESKLGYSCDSYTDGAISVRWVPAT